MKVRELIGDIEEETPLKRIRKAKMLSQSELAEATGINVRMIQHYEQGAKDISKAAAVTVVRLAKALNCTVEDLID